MTDKQPFCLPDVLLGTSPETRSETSRSHNKRRDAITSLIGTATFLLLVYGLLGAVLLIRWSWTW